METRNAYNILDIEGRDHWESRGEWSVNIQNVILNYAECDK
jgi:hypothetical protein